MEKGVSPAQLEEGDQRVTRLAPSRPQVDMAKVDMEDEVALKFPNA